MWGLIHNAGWSTFGEVEWISMETYRKIAEINVFGLILGTQKILPLLRPQKGKYRRKIERNTENVQLP